MPKVIDETRIFETVINELAIKGYHMTTTKEIAIKADVNEATLFRKYGNKQELIKRSFEYLFSEAPLSRVEYTGNLKADLQSILEAYMATNNAMGDIMPIILLEIPRHRELKDVLGGAMKNIRKIMDIIARYQEQGLLKVEPPENSVNALLSPILLHNMFERAGIDISYPPINLQDYIRNYLEGRIE